MTFAFQYETLASRQTLEASVIQQLQAQQPWLCFKISSNNDRDTMRKEARDLLTHALRTLSANNQQPLLQQTGVHTLVKWNGHGLSLSISYARHIILVGIMAGEATLGIDLVDLEALQTWSTDEIDHISHLYLTQTACYSIHTSQQKYDDFAQEWAYFEASIKASNSAINEYIEFDEIKTHIIKGLPADFIGAWAIKP